MLNNYIKIFQEHYNFLENTERKFKVASELTALRKQLILM